MDVRSNGGSDNQDGGQDQAIDNGSPQVVQNDAPNLGAIRKSGQQEVLKALGNVLGQDFGKTNDASVSLNN